MLAGAVAFAIVGLYINHDVELWSDVFFVRECVLLYAFYLMGLLLRRADLFDQLSTSARVALFVVSSAVLLSTFNLNPLPTDLMPVVLINLSQHGNPYYFAVTAVAGCFATVGLALFTPEWSWVAWVGRRTLLFMGCNGFFFAFVNRPLANAMKDTVADSHPIVFAYMMLFTVISMAISVPVVALLDRYVPQLVGRPKEEGPLLPRLM